MEGALHILHLEDCQNDAEMILDTILEKWPDCHLERVETSVEFNRVLELGGIDLILADYSLPTFDGLSALNIVSRQYSEIPFIFVSGTLGEETAVESLKNGATDYVLKSNLKRLIHSIQRALRDASEQAGIRKMAETIDKLKYALEQVPLSIIMTDPAGTIEYVNPKLMELTGYNKEELVGQKPSLFKSGLNNPEAYSELWKNITAGKMWRGELCNCRKNGELYYELAIVTPVKNSDGSIINYLAIKEDITEKKSLENQLRQAQKMEAIGQLAGGIAHDFNNILTGIIGFGTLIGMKMDTDDPQRAHLNHILAGADKAANLTKSLLAFSRKQVSNPKPVDLNDIISNIGKFIKPILGEDVDFTTSFKQPVLTVKADAGQIEQVLMNMATNARDAMPNGGQLSVETECTELTKDFVTFYGYGETGEYALITIADSGCGMDEVTRQKLYEPFFSTKPVGKGTGLGLSMVYGIIKQHNGFINVRSELGKGTTFSIYLPLIKEAAIAKDSVIDEMPSHFTGTILVADDDVSVSGMTAAVLSSFGYTVITAVDGQDAVRKFSQFQDVIDLVLLDVIMPIMNGREACEKIKEISPDVKCLFMSGYTPDLVMERGGFSTDSSFIEKPFNPRVLIKKILETLGQTSLKGSRP